MSKLCGIILDGDEAGGEAAGEMGATAPTPLQADNASAAVASPATGEGLAKKGLVKGPHRCPSCFDPCFKMLISSANCHYPQLYRTLVMPLLVRALLLGCLPRICRCDPVYLGGTAYPTTTTNPEMEHA